MRKTILLPVLALAAGLLLGTLLGFGMAGRGSSAGALMSASPGSSRAAAFPTPPPLDTEDNTLLLERSELVLDCLKDGDYAALSRLVHPAKGVTLTPYSTVSTEYDQTLTADEVARLDEDSQELVWGLLDGSGLPIRATGEEYFARFVFNADYTEAPEIGVDQVLMSGNALENVADAYPQARFVDYSFPGIDPALEGFDWCSLKLVFEPWENQWYLIAMVHGEWTI